MSIAPSLRNNLPAQVSSFIGRERELADVARLLRDQRIVTLTGSGGAGKTRLAFQAAAAKQNHFADGVWLVELAPLSVPDFVTDAIAKAVGMPDPGEAPLQSALSTYLSRKRMLLVFDNCEHLLAECARVVSTLVAQCPGVRVLCTSREPLSIAGEWVLRVPPLSLPETSQTLASDDAISYDAVRLFVERARAAEPSFRFSDVTAAPVVEICRRLDGIPLALELAAGRVRGMGVAYLGERLDDRFRLLKSADVTGAPRQRTLLALVDWSYGLLSAPERVVLRRLAVFHGSFDADAAKFVCAGEYDGTEGRATIGSDAVFDALTRLVDKSLVQFDQSGERYRMLETIRLFAAEHLDEAGETNFTNRQHVGYFLQLAEMYALADSAELNTWFKRIELEHDNLRAALDWAIRAAWSHEAARLVLDLWPFWRARTYQREGLNWLERVRELDEAHPLPLELRPRLYNALGILANGVHALERARSYQAEALRLWTEAGDTAGMAQALFDIGWQQWDAVDLVSAKMNADASLSLAESIADKRLIASALLLAGLVDAHLGNTAPAIPALERALTLWRALRDVDSIASAEGVLATAYLREGDLERARSLLADAAHIHFQTPSSTLTGTLVGLMFLAEASARSREQMRDVARVVGALTAYDAATSLEPSPWLQSAENLALAARLTQALGKEDFERMFAEGERLTSAGLLALAQRITAPSGASEAAHDAAPTAAHDALTPREREVLRLAAQGLTNNEIARELTITPRTANAHLTAIYSKLGVTSRSGAIRYAIEHQLG